MIHHESNDVRWLRKVSIGQGLWNEIVVWKMSACRGDLQGWSDYSRKPIGKVIKAIVYREYKEGDVSLYERGSPWNKD